jgi:hypothetical protein
MQAEAKKRAAKESRAMKEAMAAKKSKKVSMFDELR